MSYPARMINRFVGGTDGCQHLVDALKGLRDPFGCYGGCRIGYRTRLALREHYPDPGYTETDHTDECQAARAAVLGQETP